ncbi:DUF445 family protein [Bradyrhizobium sp. G127]|uniref:DUF445 domain-containing protein n=1 Tax=Bradyrhizobium sp. G127 TaxID=2904800 RepID=UPI001F25ABEB|nr:DUF445 family protein [Bradyrhizobium sp. G127]MCF2522892.1 DUF445 family protein [Bradyrhizobium sp. G127]
MADTEKFVLIADAGDIARAAELRRIKALATLVLGACVGVLIVAKMMERMHPAFGFVAAFAEAATIGGLADWYAVVALFRRPLGLPIPHTAIIQQNQHRIADKLGEFIEVHFLSPLPVDAKLREVDFARFISDWLTDAKKSADLARFVLRLLPEALNAAETSGLKSYVTRRIVTQLQGVDLAPLAAGTLRGFIAEGRHKGMLDDLLQSLHETLNKPETLALLREKIRDELPTLLKLYRADKFLLNKIAASATSFFEEVRADPDHPFRGEVDRILLTLPDKLANDKAYADRLDGLKRDLLARPELATLANDIWANVKTFIDRNANGESQVLQHHLTNVFVEAGTQLAADSEMRAEINKGIVVVLRSFIADQKSGVSRFISDQVKSWNMNQLINLIEINIGKDLQYIRFNGALIGGLAGLALHSAEMLVKAL